MVAAQFIAKYITIKKIIGLIVRLFSTVFVIALLITQVIAGTVCTIY